MTKRRNSDLLLLLPGRTNPESFQLEDKPQSVTHTHTHTHISVCPPHPAAPRPPDFLLLSSGSVCRRCVSRAGRSDTTTAASASGSAAASSLRPRGQTDPSETSHPAPSPDGQTGDRFFKPTCKPGFWFPQFPSMLLCVNVLATWSSRLCSRMPLTSCCCLGSSFLMKKTISHHSARLSANGSLCRPSDRYGSEYRPPGGFEKNV